MPTAPDSQEAHGYVKRIIRHLPHNPALALDMLPSVPCTDARCKLATLIAQSWPRTDINTAWNAVARSPLNATEKQPMFNELWG